MSVRNSYPTIKDRQRCEIKISPFNSKTRMRSSNAKKRPTTLHFNPTSFNLRSKQVFPKLGLGNFLRLKEERVGEDEERAYQ